ncbi:MAG: HepT-like ribonuclease domain-containing protein [Bryobacteraceae bacterium]
MRALEIISEASRRLPADLKARHPGVDWTAIAASGNIYHHEYGRVDEQLIWHTIREDLHPLNAIVADELARLQTGRL